MGSTSMSMMKMKMKMMHQFPRAFWDHIQPAHHSQPFSSESSSDAVCKKRRPSPAPKMAHTSHKNSSLALKSFIRPDTGPPGRLSAASSDDISRFTKDNQSTTQLETHPGGTRWSPTQQQIGILEILYKGGMRTPKAHQIEHITDKLAKYGKIEGKNVFYWFQNHKARERQKQKRQRLGHAHSPTSPHSATPTASNNITTLLNLDMPTKLEEHLVAASEGVRKRRCRSWTFDRYADEEVNEDNNDAMNSSRSYRSDDEGSACTTLQLFPLHPERRRS